MSALINLAVLESEVLGRHDEAIVWARQRLDRRPIDSDVFYHLSWPLLFLRDDATTDRWLSEGQRRFPRNPRLQYLRAALQYLQGDEAGALAGARRIIDEQPAFEEGLMVQAELAFLTGAPDAEQLIERMQRRVPGLLSGPLLKQESNRTSLCLAADGSRRALARRDTAVRGARSREGSAGRGQREPAGPVRDRRHPRHAEATTPPRSSGSRRRRRQAIATTRPLRAIQSSSACGASPRFQAVLATMEKRVTSMRDRSTVLAELRTLPFPEAAATPNPPSAR